MCMIVTELGMTTNRGGTIVAGTISVGKVAKRGLGPVFWQASVKRSVSVYLEEQKQEKLCLDFEKSCPDWMQHLLMKNLTNWHFC